MLEMSHAPLPHCCVWNPAMAGCGEGLSGQRGVLTFVYQGGNSFRAERDILFPLGG